MASYWDSAVPAEQCLVLDPSITAHVFNLLSDLSESGIVLIDALFSPDGTVDQLKLVGLIKNGDANFTQLPSYIH